MDVNQGCMEGVCRCMEVSQGCMEGEPEYMECMEVSQSVWRVYGGCM